MATKRVIVVMIDGLADVLKNSGQMAIVETTVDEALESGHLQ